MSVSALFKEKMNQLLQGAGKYRYLVAFSGGMDSVVLAHLCCKLGLEFRLAHVNFQLRGEESTRDENFARSFAQTLGVDIAIQQVDTQAYANEHSLSVQEAARQFRYNWFKQLGEAWGAGGEKVFILTAHHLDDAIETQLMFFFRGTGLAGLTGIPEKNDTVIRPLIDLPRNQLAQYAAENALEWVEDSSNLTEKYTRNFFRHSIIPYLENLMPELKHKLAGNLNRFREAYKIYDENVQSKLQKLLELRGQETWVPVRKLLTYPYYATLLFEWLHPLGFSPAQVQECAKLLQSETGKYISTKNWRLLRNRNWLVLTPVNLLTAVPQVIDEPGTVLFDKGTIQLILSQQGPKEFPSLANEVWLDGKEVQFPILIRPWKKGDYFYPLGMEKKKKVARFLIDQKVSKSEKENIWVLESNQRILWVIGYRIDNRFKIKTSTSTFIQLKWKPMVKNHQTSGA